MDTLQGLTKKLAGCRNFVEICQLMTVFPLTNQKFSGAILASVGADARGREIGRYGVHGFMPDQRYVSLANSGIVVHAMSKRSPTLIRNMREIARGRLLTPDSDLDELMLENDFDSALLLPLYDGDFLYGLLGLLTKAEIIEEPQFGVDYETLQALLSMAIRAVSFRMPVKPQSEIVMPAELTVREQGVLALLAQDKSNKEISLELNISISSTKVAVSEILRKLKVQSRKQAGIEARYSQLQ